MVRNYCWLLCVCYWVHPYAIPWQVLIAPDKGNCLLTGTVALLIAINGYNTPAAWNHIKPLLTVLKPGHLIGKRTQIQNLDTRFYWTLMTAFWEKNVFLKIQAKHIFSYWAWVLVRQMSREIWMLCEFVESVQGGEMWLHKFCAHIACNSQRLPHVCSLQVLESSYSSHHITYFTVYRCPCSALHTHTHTDIQIMVRNGARGYYSYSVQQTPKCWMSNIYLYYKMYNYFQNIYWKSFKHYTTIMINLVLYNLKILSHIQYNILILENKQIDYTS